MVVMLAFMRPDFEILLGLTGILLLANFTALIMAGISLGMIHRTVKLIRLKEGQSYGWPYTYDDKQVDPDFGAGNEDKIAASKAMVHGLGGPCCPAWDQIP